MVLPIDKAPPPLPRAPRAKGKKGTQAQRGRTNEPWRVSSGDAGPSRMSDDDSDESTVDSPVSPLDAFMRQRPGGSVSSATPPTSPEDSWSSSRTLIGPGMGMSLPSINASGGGVPMDDDAAPAAAAAYIAASTPPHAGVIFDFTAPTPGTSPAPTPTPTPQNILFLTPHHPRKLHPSRWRPLPRAVPVASPRLPDRRHDGRLRTFCCRDRAPPIRPAPPCAGGHRHGGR